MYLPGSAKAWVAAALVAVAPSPKVQEYVATGDQASTAVASYVAG